jgi:hypothetical protein
VDGAVWIAGAASAWRRPVREDYATAIKVEGGERPRPRSEKSHDGPRPAMERSTAHDVHPARPAAGWTTIAVLTDASFALAPATGPRGLSHQQASHAVAGRAFHSGVAEAALASTPGACFGGVVDGWLCHRPSSVGWTSRASSRMPGVARLRAPGLSQGDYTCAGQRQRAAPVQNKAARLRVRLHRSGALGGT